MDLSTKVLGGSTVAYLHARQTLPVVKIGKNTYTRAQLAKVACFTFSAAANLSKILARFKVADTRDVFERVSPDALAVPRLGAVSLAVLGAIFEIEGLGGNSPLEAWVKHHLGQNAKIVTFTTLKLRDEKERAAERKTRRQRKATRRDKAHHTRVDRFMTRGGSAHV